MKFKVGDRVVGIGSFEGGFKVEGLSGVIVLSTPENLGKIYQIRFDTGKYWWVHAKNLKPEDPEEIIKRIKKKKELNLKMKDVDPYGEEDWTM